MSTELVYGLHDLQDYRDRTLESVGTQVISTAVDAFYANYNATMNEWLARMTRADPIYNVQPLQKHELPLLPSMQTVTADGYADPAKGYPYYEAGIPLFRGEYARGYSREAQRLRTVGQLDADLRAATQSDLNWLRLNALKALFYNSSWTYRSAEDDKQFQSTMPIMPLANGDSRLYPFKNNTMATAQHYTAQANAIGDGADDPFQTIRDTLDRYLSSSGQYVSFVPTGLVSSIRALSAFYPIQNTEFTDRPITEARVRPTIDTRKMWGDEVIGEHDSGVVIVKWDMLPAGYILTVDMNSPAIGLREHINPLMRGLEAREFVTKEGLEYRYYWRRLAGMAVVNPLAAHVHRVGNGSYAVPTGFSPAI
jgi:hypothetical protein